MAGLDAGNPPFDPSTLKAPLTPDQRAKILAWMALNSTNVNSGNSNLPDFNTISRASDPDLIKYYTVEAAAYKAVQAPPISAGVITNPIKSVTDFLNRIYQAISNGQFWLRVAEGGLGLLLIAVGVNTVVLGNSPVGKFVKG